MGKGFKTRVIFVVSLFVICLTGGYLLGEQYYSYKREAKIQEQIVKKTKPSIENSKPKDGNDSAPTSKIEGINSESHWETKTLKHNDQGIPIVMYHSIAYEKGNPVRLPKEKFKEQMEYLKNSGYTTLTLDQAYNFFTKDKAVPEKSIVLTFDDGYVDNYKDAFPILKEYGFTATIFVITDYVGKSTAYMNLKELQEMQSYGIDIESHTVNHEYLNQISYEKQLKTVKESKEFLEKGLNKKIQYIAYPYGKYNEATLKAVKEAGYIMAVTTDGKWSDKTDGIFTLDRVYISGFADLSTFKERVTNPNYKTME